MARSGVFKIPKELKDEDKWFRYFTKKQAVPIAVTLLIDYRIIMWASQRNFLLPAIIVSVILTLLVAGIVMVELPVDVLFLSGGGITMEQWIRRVFIRKRNRKIYVKNYDMGEDP